MKKLLAVATLLLATTAAQAQYTFEYGGRTIRIDPDRGTVQIPGVYDNTGKGSKRAKGEDSATTRKPKSQEAKTDPQTTAAPAPAPAEQTAAPTAPAATTPPLRLPRPNLRRPPRPSRRPIRRLVLRHFRRPSAPQVNQQDVRRRAPRLRRLQRRRRHHRARRHPRLFRPIRRSACG